MAECVFMLTPDGVITAAGRDWAALTPGNGGPPTGRLLAEFLDADQRDDCRQAVERAMKGTVLQVQLRAGDRDWNATLAPFPSTDAPAGVAAFLRSQSSADATRNRVTNRAIRTIGHDLNNLLTIIVGLNGLMTDGLDSSRIPLYTGEIGKAADRAARLAFELVALGRKHEAATLINMNGLITELRPLIARLAGAAELETELDPAVPPVTTERSAVIGLIVELMTCAAALVGPEGRICVETLVPAADRATGGRATGCAIRLRVPAAVATPDESLVDAVHRAAAATQGSVQVMLDANMPGEVIVDVRLAADERLRTPTPQ